MVQARAYAQAAVFAVASTPARLFGSAAVVTTSTMSPMTAPVATNTDWSHGVLPIIWPGRRPLRSMRMVVVLPTVARLIDGLHAQNVRHQFRTVLAPGRASQSLQEHRSIVDALATGDGETAEAAMRAHLSNVVRTLRSLQSVSTSS